MDKLISDALRQHLVAYVSALRGQVPRFARRLRAAGERFLAERDGLTAFVIGAIHTNTIEGFWSIFKRGRVGTFHKVSRKYMPLYVAELQFRYNNRMNPNIFAAAIEGC